MKSDIQKKNRKRYRLHHLIRKEGYKLITKKRTIFVPYTNMDVSKNVERLRSEFDYGVQTEII